MRRNFPEPESRYLVEIFEWVVLHGGKEDPFVERNEGASFNPRPARVVQLIMRDGRHKMPLTLAAAMLCGIPHAAQAEAAARFPGEQSMACRAHHLFLSPGPATMEEELIASAYAVDTVRHLRMSSREPAERIAQLERAESLSSSLRLICDTPLASLLHATVSRYRPLVYC